MDFLSSLQSLRNLSLNAIDCFYCDFTCVTFAIPKEETTANMSVTILHVIHRLTHKPLASKDSEQVRGSFRFSPSFYTSFQPYDSRKYIIDRHQLMRPAIILRGVARPSDLTSLVDEELAFSASIVLSLLYVHKRARTVLYLFLSLRPTYDELIFDVGMPAIWNCVGITSSRGPHIPPFFVSC